MKISARQYAQGLFGSVSGKTEKEVKAALKNFVAVLGKNRELGRAQEIISIFNELWDKAHGELHAQLTSARELGPTAREAITDYLKEKTGAKKIKLEENLDKDILGGFVLRYESKVVDASLKTNLEELKERLEN